MAPIYHHLDTHDQLRMCCNLSAWYGLCTDPQGSSLGKTFPHVDTDDPQNIPGRLLYLSVPDCCYKILLGKALNFLVHQDRNGPPDIPNNL